MAKTRVTLECDPPALQEDLSETLARSHQIHHVWERRREIDWRITREDLSARARTHPTRHQITLGVVNAGERPDGTRIEIIRLAIDLETRDGEDAMTKARRVLDLPVEVEAPTRRPAATGIMDTGSLHRVRGETVISPMPMRWPVGRHITDYSHYLGSYGQGGVGLSGWQLNGGSWMVLPLSHSDGWITLTMEEVESNAERTRLDIVVDQRIIGVNPGQRDAFPPWDFNYAGHQRTQDLPDFRAERALVTRFEATGSGFVLETGRGQRNWRFEMGDHLPRPAWGGSGEPRLLREGESIVDSFILTHDMYLEV